MYVGVLQVSVGDPWTCAVYWRMGSGEAASPDSYSVRTARRATICRESEYWSRGGVGEGELNRLGVDCSPYAD